MPVQQRHAHLRRHGDRLFPALRVENGLAAFSRGQVDEEGPRGASRNRF